MKSALSVSVVLALGATFAMAADSPTRPMLAPAQDVYVFGGKAVVPTDQLTTQVYRVSDLVLPAPNYAFEGVHLPGAGPFRRSGASSSGGGMGGGIGGGAGGTGGGFFSVPLKSTILEQRGRGGMGEDMGGGMGGRGYPRGGMAAPRVRTPNATGLRFSMDDLIEAITSTIAPDSWDENGGPGTIAPLGGLLIVRQHADIHKQLGLLLDELRSQGGTITSVTIRAHWVVLAGDQLRKLAPTIDSPDWQAARGGLNREALSQFTATAGAVGQITCFSGQTVHIISGNYRNWTTGVTPVVGQLDRSNSAPQVAQQDRRGDKAPTGAAGAVAQQSGRHYLAQMASATPATPGLGRRSAVGYQTQSAFVNFGALLQITPVLVADSDAVIVDVQSSVVRRKQQADASVDFLGVLPLDRLDLLVQQFMTTLRMPLGQPVLVGGSTLEPISLEAQPSQLYLVLEATKL